MRTIVLINKSSRVSKAEASAMAKACDIQVKRDFAPAWGILPFKVKVGTEAKVGEIPFYIFDKPDEDGALGYHSEADDAPYAKIFVNPVLDEHGVVLLDPKNNQTPTVASVLSHEVLEFIADPACTYWSQGPKITQGDMYALEVCDPVESDQYVINGVAVSNFVTPEWFDSQVGLGESFDFLGKLKAPFTMTAGGYMVVMKSSGGVDVYGRKASSWKKAARKRNKMSRAHKRTKGKLHV